MIHLDYNRSVTKQPKNEINLVNVSINITKSNKLDSYDSLKEFFQVLLALLVSK